MPCDSAAAAIRLPHRLKSAVALPTGPTTSTSFLGVGASTDARLARAGRSDALEAPRVGAVRPAAAIAITAARRSAIRTTPLTTARRPGLWAKSIALDLSLRRLLGHARRNVLIFSA